MQATPGREAADEIDYRAQIRASLGRKSSDGLLVKKIRLNEHQIVAAFNALKLGFVDPRNDHAPAAGDEARDNGGTETASSTRNYRCLLHLSVISRSERPQPYANCPAPVRNRPYRCRRAA